MLRRLLLALLVCLLYATPALATRQRLFGWCEDGGTAVTVPGTPGSGTQRFQQTFRSCTVTVYLVGTSTLATIYSDDAGTAKANPFTASALGRWDFYADGGTYDVRFSGGGITSPFTIGGYRVPNDVFDVTDFGAKCDGTTNDYTAINAARVAATAQTNGGTVLIPSNVSGSCIVNTSITFDADVVVRFEGGGRISMATATTATYNGGVTAPAVQVFAGAGTHTVNGAATPAQLPQWWSAKGDGVFRSTCNIATSTTLTCTDSDASFTSADVGKSIVVIGGGATQDVTLATTIAGFTNANVVTLTAAAGRTTTGLNVRYSTNDTSAIAAAMASATTGVDLGFATVPACVYFSAGNFGFTTIRLNGRQCVIGESIEGTNLWRMGVGSGGAAIAMNTSEIARDLRLADFQLEANLITGGLDALDLGTETPNTTDYCCGSIISNVKIRNATGYCLDLQYNVGYVENIWCGNQLAAAFYPSTSKGVRFQGVQMLANLVNIEGNYPGGTWAGTQNGSQFNKVQFEVDAASALDVLTCDGPGNTFISPYALIGSTATAHTSFIRRTTNCTTLTVVDAQVSVSAPATVTCFLDDDNTGQCVSTSITVLPSYIASSSYSSANFALANQIGVKSADQNLTDTIVTYQTMGIGAATSPTSNNAMNWQTIYNGATRKRYAFLNGGLGSTATAASPTFTSGTGVATTLMSDGSNLSIQEAAAGTNVSPTTIGIFGAGGFVPRQVTAAGLAALTTNGLLVYVTDGAVTGAGDNTCAGGGNGALGFRINGTWRCFSFQN